jgi:hypothetical protein
MTIEMVSWARRGSLAVAVMAASCGSAGTTPDGGGSNGDATSVTPRDPATAPRAPVDRFSATAGHLFVRTASNGLPAANAPIAFDTVPGLITQGKGPAGQVVRYYNFDVQPTAPAPIYVLVRTGETAPVAGQLNIVDMIPGDAGYNDFWRIVRVTVPASYVANTITSETALRTAGFAMETTPMLVNCPVVPEGSTAARRLNGADASLHRGWYRDQVVTYFTFEERALTASNDRVPVSPIFVTFVRNPSPSDATSGPPSGFVVEPGTMQTHNVIATVPADAGYSPLWSVSAYDNANFASVMDLPTATAAPLVAPNVATVNCPVVSIE